AHPRVAGFDLAPDGCRRWLPRRVHDGIRHGRSFGAPRPYDPAPCMSVRRKQTVRLTEGVEPIATPAVMCRIVDHRRPHRVELNVSLTFQVVGLGLDMRKLVPAVPERPRTPIAAIDVLHVRN